MALVGCFKQGRQVDRTAGWKELEVPQEPNGQRLENPLGLRVQQALRSSPYESARRDGAKGQHAYWRGSQSVQLDQLGSPSTSMGVSNHTVSSRAASDCVCGKNGAPGSDRNQAPCKASQCWQWGAR